MTPSEGLVPAREGDLSGRRFVVTGASSGIGEAAAAAFAARGAHVVLAVRDAGRGKAAAERIRTRVPRADLEMAELDLASLDSVRRFSSSLLAAGEPIDVLVNNAGVMAIPRRETADGFEMQFGTNHLGHFALTGLLLPLLLAAPAPRVVTITSIAHRSGRIDFDDLQGERAYDKRRAYSQSKLANLMFALELARRADAAGLPLLSLAAHPGLAATNLGYAGPQMEGKGWSTPIIGAINRLLPSADDGARPTVLAATGVGLRSGAFAGPRGPLGLWGRPELTEPAPTALDLAVASRLWEASEALTGVSYGALDDAAA